VLRDEVEAVRYILLISEAAHKELLFPEVVHISGRSSLSSLSHALDSMLGVCLAVLDCLSSVGSVQSIELSIGNGNYFIASIFHHFGIL
jgi:hypothetical protein